MQKEPKAYQRFRIATRKCTNLVKHPHRFKVIMNRWRLAKHILKELWIYRGRLDVVASRPCVYGVFSGPIGGFAPKDELCVGCLRCTTQYPDMVTIAKNPARAYLGDSFFKPDDYDTIISEVESGRIPIKGAGYRGKFGGKGWDAMWTDMSEIVRPTRDGIHGREFISTEVNIGSKPARLQFNRNKRLEGEIPNAFSIPTPILFDKPPQSLLNNETLIHALIEGAKHTRSYVILPFELIQKYQIQSHFIPLINRKEIDQFLKSGRTVPAIEMDGWDKMLFHQLKKQYPDIPIILRTRFENLLESFQEGVRAFHLIANYHGKEKDQFILDLIRKAHTEFVEAKCRDQVSLIGSGGIIAAEHLPKAIICGLDAVALDTPCLVALQAKFHGECVDSETSNFSLPKTLTARWGGYRIANLVAAWRDQLLEILGAMGIREVRRLRGEMGRAMFQNMLEAEAFTGIDGYESR